jgi:hypothetical protein
MARVSYAQRIRLRVKEIEQQLAHLATELEELRVAEKVLGRLGEEADELDAHEKGESSNQTISDHIVLVLNTHGRLSSPDLHKVMVEQYRPTLSYNSVGATLSRMRVKGIVDNYDGKWFVVSKAPTMPVFAGNNIPWTQEALQRDGATSQPPWATSVTTRRPMPTHSPLFDNEDGPA